MFAQDLKFLALQTRNRETEQQFLNGQFNSPEATCNGGGGGAGVELLPSKNETRGHARRTALVLEWRVPRMHSVSPGVACAPHALGSGAYMPTEAWLVAEP